MSAIGVGWMHRVLRACLGTIATLLVGGVASGQPAELTGDVFPPAQGKGAIVVVVSGRSGLDIHREASARFASLGYYTVLIDGNDVLDRDDPTGERGISRLRRVIDAVQNAPQAQPGKAALVGYGLGGAGVLMLGARMDARVSAVVAYYPRITGTDVSQLAAGFRVPVLVLSGANDQYYGCCRIETMRALAAAPKSVPFDLIEYAGAGHGFNLFAPHRGFVYLPEAADDSWAKTAAFLARVHPPVHAK